MMGSMRFAMSRLLYLLTATTLVLRSKLMCSNFRTICLVTLAAVTAKAQQYTTYYLHWSPVSTPNIGTFEGYLPNNDKLSVATFGEISGTIQIDASQAVSSNSLFPAWIGDITLSFTPPSESPLTFTKADFEQYVLFFQNLPATGSVLSEPGFTDFNLFGQRLNGVWSGVLQDTVTSTYYHLDHFSTNAIPEPSTYGLILGGLALAGAAIRRRRKA